MADVIEPTYLPFTPENLKPHFLVDADRQIAYFQESAKAYRELTRENPNREGISIAELRHPCQVEKDERFWTATAMKRLVAAPEALEHILKGAFGGFPPVSPLQTWGECLRGHIQLIFEAALPSPADYVASLRRNLGSHHLIPYVTDAAQRAKPRALEGPTHVDALVLNIDNGFSLFVESKVLSDIAYAVTFDMYRNQIARNIDVMLDQPVGLDGILKLRRPEASLFALLTPSCFRDRPHSRLYGWLLREYKTTPSALGRDLQYRSGVDWSKVARRLGWITFEDIQEAIPDACPWLGSGRQRKV